MSGPDIVIIGTGLAALIAARRLLEEGYSPLILNPDPDFFQEESELAFQPLTWARAPVTARQIELQRADQVVNELRPHFPGPLELWRDTPGREAARDARAPFVRARQWVWLSEGLAPGTGSSDRGGASLAEMENLFVESSDRGLTAQWLDGLLALRRFPGFSLAGGSERRGFLEHIQAVSISDLGDVDIEVYRTGLLEFLRERLGAEKVVVGAGPIELLDEGLRYFEKGTPRIVAPDGGVFVFCTPRLIRWLASLQNRLPTLDLKPAGYEVWERWSILSREAIDPSMVGVFGDSIVWGEAYPGGSRRENLLGVLRYVGKFPSEQAAAVRWFDGESFSRPQELTRGLLGWEGLTLRSARAHLHLAWDDDRVRSATWGKRKLPFHLVPYADGAAASIAGQVRKALGGGAS
jgi:hypothetical protein